MMISGGFGMRFSLVCAVVVLGLGLGGCKSSNSCRATLADASAATPCLNEVSSDDGGAIATGQCFAKPEICPGKGGFPFCEHPVGSSYRDSVEIQNRGQSPLTIYSIRTRGDDHCAFVDPALSGSPDGGVPTTIAPDDTAILSFRFVPPSLGQFNALIELETNAENFPVLRIPVCGIGVAADAGVNPIDDGGVQVCGLPDCEDRSGADFSRCWNGWGEGTPPPNSSTP
jgi:hypothetical protein